MPTFAEVVENFQIDPKDSGFLATVHYLPGWVPKIKPGETYTEHGIDNAVGVTAWITALYADPTQYVNPAP
jgi:hypothetical protein